MKHKGHLITHVQQEAREAETRPLSIRLIARLFTYTRPYAAKRNTLLLLVVLRSIQLPALAWVIAAVIGGPISRMNGPGIALGAAGYGLLAIATQLVLRYRSRLALELGEEVIADLRKQMFAHILRLPMPFYHKTRLGTILSRFTSDSEAVRQGVQNVLFVSLVNLGQMTVAAALMIWYDAFLFLIVAALAPVLWLTNRYFSRRLGSAYRAVQESFSRVTATLAESVSGIRVTQGFVREEVNAGLFHDLVSDHSRYNMDAARVAGIFIPLLEFKTQMFVASVLLVGGWRVLNGLAEVESLYQFLLMAAIFFAPIQALANMFNTALSAMAGAERIFRLLDTQPEWSDPPGAVTLPTLRGEVEFRNVTFEYDPQRPVLRDITFTVEPGQTIALVGHTGSGKSSLINLIAKFYLPTRGQLLIDGHDLTTVRTESLQRQLGIVLQENFLFTGSVLENIRMGRADATREDVVRAAKDLDCLDIIAGLPDGFNTVVGEKGSGISLGQRQMICFARALLANPRILVMDEATSSVDTMTEARIQKALERLLSDRTSFVVAHRLSTIRHADVVIVLQDGRVAERGTHEELLTRGEHYAELYREFVRAGDAAV